MHVDFCIDNYIDMNIIQGKLYNFKVFTISKCKEPRNKRERRACFEKGRAEETLQHPPESSRISVHRNPFRGNSRERFYGNSRFSRSAIFTVLFARAVRLLHVNSLTFHSLDASVYGHLSLSLLFSESSLLSLSLFPLSSQSTHTRRNIARSSKRSFETHA